MVGAVSPSDRSPSIAIYKLIKVFIDKGRLLGLSTAKDGG